MGQKNWILTVLEILLATIVQVWYGQLALMVLLTHVQVHDKADGAMNKEHASSGYE